MQQRIHHAMLPAATLQGNGAGPFRHPNSQLPAPCCASFRAPRFRGRRCHATALPPSHVPAAALPPPPVAPKLRQTIELHGVKRHDSYFWMRDTERYHTQLLPLLRAENKHTAAVLADTLQLQGRLQGAISQLMWAAAVHSSQPAAGSVDRYAVREGTTNSSSDSGSVGDDSDSASPGALPTGGAPVVAGNYAFSLEAPVQGARFPACYRTPLPAMQRPPASRAATNGAAKGFDAEAGKHLVVDFTARAAAGGASAATGGAGSAYSLHSVAPSLDGRYLAWTESAADNNGAVAAPGTDAEAPAAAPPLLRLCVLDLGSLDADAAAVCLAENASGPFAWAADGKHVLFTAQQETALHVAAVSAPGQARQVYADHSQVRVLLSRHQLPCETGPLPPRAASSSGSNNVKDGGGDGSASQHAAVSGESLDGHNNVAKASSSGGSSGDAAARHLMLLTTLAGNTRPCEVQYKLCNDAADAPWRQLVSRQHAAYCQVRRNLR